MPGVHHLYGDVRPFRRHLHGCVPVRDADPLRLHPHPRVVACKARRLGNFPAKFSTRALDTVPGRQHRGRYHHVLRLHARGRGNVAARICGQEPEGGKRGPLPRNARLWAHDSPRLVHGRGRAPARSGGKDHRLRLDGCGRPGIGDRNSPGGAYGVSIGRHFVCYHVHSRQLSDRLRADLRPRYLQDLQAWHFGEKRASAHACVRGRAAAGRADHCALYQKRV